MPLNKPQNVINQGEAHHDRQDTRFAEYHPQKLEQLTPGILTITRATFSLRLFVRKMNSPLAELYFDYVRDE